MAPTTTRLPTVTGQPIPGLDTAAFHAAFGKTGFTQAPPTSLPGFTTTTSKRADATISTYGKGPADVVSIVAEADLPAAASILPAVVAAVAKGPDARKADAWVLAQLKQRPSSASGPRSASSTFGGLPYELLVNAVTATLSIGRLQG